MRTKRGTKCHKCKKMFQELVSYTEYGLRYYNTKDDKEYCEECFNAKFGDKENEKSNNKE